MADDNTFPSFSPMPNLAQPGGAAMGYGDPKTIQAAYLRMLQERGKQGAKAPMMLSPWQAIGGIADTAADQIQMNRLMQGAGAASQNNAALALPGAGGGAPSTEPPALSGQAPASAPDDLVGFIKAHEGYKPTAYPDGKQYSIGWGSKANSPDETIDQAEASRRLTGDLDKAAGSVQAFAPNAPDGIKRALTDLTYNTGTKWQGAGLGKAVQAGDWETAKGLFTQYNHADGQVKPGLTERRQAAAAWFPGGGGSGTPGGTQVAGPAMAAAAPSPGAGNAPAGPSGNSGGQAGAPGSDPFAPRTGTFVNPTDLPGRPKRDWQAIQRQWATLSPQQQQDYIKEFQETNGGKNPMQFTLPSGAGMIQYHPDNPGQQTFYPKIGIEKSKDVSGNEREFEYVLDPKTGARQYRGGNAPPTAEESIAGQAKVAGAKKLAEQYPGGPEVPAAAGGAGGTAPDAKTQDMATFIKNQPDAYPAFPGKDAPASKLAKYGSQQKEYEGSSEEFRKEYKQISKEALDARDSKSQLQLLEKVLQNPNVQSGFANKTISNWNDAGRVAGLTKGEIATWNAIAEKLGSRQQVSDIRETNIGQGVAVRATEASAIKASQFSLDRTPEANLAVARLQLKAADRIIDNGEFANAYAKEHGRLDNGYYQARDEWFAAHPFMSDEELNHYTDLTKGATSPDRSTEVTGPAGANPQYQENLKGKEFGDVIPGSPLAGRGLPGGTPGQKAAALGTAAMAGTAIGGVPFSGGAVKGLQMSPGLRGAMQAGAGPTSPSGLMATPTTQESIANVLKGLGGGSAGHGLGDWAKGGIMFEIIHKLFGG